MNNNTHTELFNANIEMIDNSHKCKQLRDDNNASARSTINYIMNAINEPSVIGETKKQKINFVLLNELEGLKAKQFHPKFKLAIKVARSTMIDGYKIRHDLISITQCETLINEFTKETVNGLFDKYDVLSYADGISLFLKSKKEKKQIFQNKVIGDKPKKSKK